MLHITTAWSNSNPFAFGVLKSLVSVSSTSPTSLRSIATKTHHAFSQIDLQVMLVVLQFISVLCCFSFSSPLCPLISVHSSTQTNMAELIAGSGNKVLC